MSGENPSGKGDESMEPSFARRLILSQAPIPQVLKEILSDDKPDKETEQDLARDCADYEELKMEYLAQTQEKFADVLSDCWNLEYGPSKRYLKHLLTEYIKVQEEQHDATRDFFDTIQSNALAELVVQASLTKMPLMPEADESCHLSFYLPPERMKSEDNASNKSSHDSDVYLRIQVYNYHNDVALRLWEAAAALAEYFLVHKEVCIDKSILELGAGTGLTGLVLQGCCGAKSTFLTNYTPACRDNLQHNLEINQEWLQKHHVEPSTIQQGYLEWNAFSDDNYVATTDDEKRSMNAFEQTDLLIAADVIYDVEAIKGLVKVIHKFLRGEKDKAAILAVTKRNLQTFGVFLEHVLKEGIDCEWLVRDCSVLPKLFYCNFTQDRCDVQIAMLTMKS